MNRIAESLHRADARILSERPPPRARRFLRSPLKAGYPSCCHRNMRHIVFASVHWWLCSRCLKRTARRRMELER